PSPAPSPPRSILQQLVAELDAGRVRVVDLTQPLGPDTPVIGLPPQFASSPGVTIEVISRYDDKGPGWYWNTLHLGEHTGTHFDAPIPDRSSTAAAARCGCWRWWSELAPGADHGGTAAALGTAMSMDLDAQGFVSRECGTFS